MTIPPVDLTAIQTELADLWVDVYAIFEMRGIETEHDPTKLAEDTVFEVFQGFYWDTARTLCLWQEAPF